MASEALIQAGITALIQLIVQASKSGQLTPEQQATLTTAFDKATDAHNTLQDALENDQ